MEEKIRQYFTKMGFFSVRSIKYEYDSFDITDVDVWLYNKTSHFTRERIIVDVKNKKTPQAIERIFWVRGLLTALRVSGAMVATTERRESVTNFGKLNGVSVLDGNFLSSLQLDTSKMMEEDFIDLFKNKSEPEFYSKWLQRYSDLKKVLLNMDYSGLNYLISKFKVITEECIVNPIRRESVCRLLYCNVGYILVVLDYLTREFATLTDDERKEKLNEALKFGNLGRAGIERTLEIAMSVAKQPYNVKADFMKMYDSLPVNIFTEYFPKQNNLEKYLNRQKDLKVMLIRLSLLVLNKLSLI